VTVIPVAGLDLATHVFVRYEAGSAEGVDARVKPGQGVSGEVTGASIKLQ